MEKARENIFISFAFKLGFFFFFFVAFLLSIFWIAYYKYCWVHVLGTYIKNRQSSITDTRLIFFFGFLCCF